MLVTLRYTAQTDSVAPAFLSTDQSFRGLRALFFVLQPLQHLHSVAPARCV